MRETEKINIVAISQELYVCITDDDYNCLLIEERL